MRTKPKQKKEIKKQKQTAPKIKAKPNDSKQGDVHGLKRYANIGEIIEMYVKNFPEINYAIQLAEKIIHDNIGVNYSAKHLSELIRNWKRDNNFEPKLIIPPGSVTEEKFRVIDGSYMWKASKGEISMPVELIDQMFYEYSRHGLDMTQNAVRRKHSLQIWEWHTIKGTLQMYKDSNIISPWTEDNTPKEKLDELISSRIQMKLQDRQRLIEKEYESQTLKEYKTVIKKDATKSFAIENMVDHLYDLFKASEPRIITIQRAKQKSSKECIAVLADLHMGARVEEMRLTPEFNPEKLKARLDDIADQINERGCSDVDAMILGDIIESFTGTNHKGMWKEIEYGYIGAKVIKEAVTAIENFAMRVINLRSMTILAGNHDRYSPDWKEDRKGEIAEIIAWALQKSMGSAVKINFAFDFAPVQIGKLAVIGMHGHKKGPKDVRQAVIDSKLDNADNYVIVSGHLHSRHVKEDTYKYRWIVSPSVFSGNSYSEDNGFTAQPGFLFIEEKDGLPIITDVTIK